MSPIARNRPVVNATITKRSQRGIISSKAKGKRWQKILNRPIPGVRVLANMEAGGEARVRFSRSWREKTMNPPWK